MGILGLWVGVGVACGCDVAIGAVCCSLARFIKQTSK